jgi:hypothetical protein
MALKILYCIRNHVNTVDNKDMNHVFSHYHPEIYELVLNARKYIKTNIYFQLEKMEAEFIFNVICFRLYNEIKDIKIVTSNDTIYVQEKFQNDVQKIWEEELNKLYSNFIFEDEDVFDNAIENINSMKYIKKSNFIIDTHEEEDIEELVINADDADVEDFFPNEDPGIREKIINLPEDLEEIDF